MLLRVLDDEDSVAVEAASLIAAEAGRAIASRGVFTVAFSGGSTPWKMFRILAQKSGPWEMAHVFQVDERVAPDGHPDRNLTNLMACLSRGDIPAANIHPMPVNETDISLGLQYYGRILREIAGDPPVLDLVHLGLGVDGHTASLVPGDSVLRITDQDVAITGNYMGRIRMTLTFPIINRSRKILWLVTGSGKAEMLARLYNGDMSIPCGRVKSDQAIVFADKSAARKLVQTG